MARTPNPLRPLAVAAACAVLLTAGCGHSSKKKTGATGRSTTSTSSSVDVTSTSVTLVPATTAPPSSGQTVKLGDKDSGKTVPAHPGDAIVLTLTDCFSCGYHWNITTAPDANVVAHRSTQDTQANNPPGQVGGSGTRVFTFQAVRAGTTHVVLGYFPPAKGAAAESTYELTFTVA
ncbi:MAG: protease inhibitor I42 family protein [Actinobacteria bacterium]|nr:protease inhibitor I42 family protein [Actinomycetota bacterium]MBV9933402.1 protease inhibitor I42 family protein [Actinomycetota bacterium]